MTHLNKREILIALAVIASGGASAALAQGVCTAPDLQAGREIGAAWLAANPGADPGALRAELLPDGICEDALDALSARVRADFRENRLFVYRGWRLAETEARIFAAATQA